MRDGVRSKDDYVRADDAKRLSVANLPIVNRIANHKTTVREHMSHCRRIRRLLSLAICVAAATVPMRLPAQSADRGEIGIELSGIGATGENVDNVLLRVEEEYTGRLIPLLPYVFFDEGSSALAARYVHPDSGSTTEPFVRHYRSILDVVGRRMQDNPRERLVITGASSMTGRDRRRGLAHGRAMAIANRLASQYGIARARLAVRARGLPLEASNNGHAEGRAENQRAELSGSDVLLAPISVADTLARAASPGMRIMPSIVGRAGVAGWAIELRHDRGLFRRLHGTSSISAVFNETFTESELRRFAVSPTGIDVTMIVLDANGDSTVLPVRTILFRTDRTRRPLTATEGRPQDRESIILFGFDRAEIREDSKIILRDLIARIPASASLRVTGYTDETGDSTSNQILSAERASAVSAALPGRVSSSRGGGESGGHHWNRLPEDRFYSRTARLFVE